MNDENDDIFVLCIDYHKKEASYELIHKSLENSSGSGEVRIEKSHKQKKDANSIEYVKEIRDQDTSKLKRSNRTKVAMIWFHEKAKNVNEVTLTYEKPNNWS